VHRIAVSSDVIVERRSIVSMQLRSGRVVAED
jgi:hypothetical protein